jgi:glyoxylase-like metal-dependent hydrolase (beta-lactamase superfamily II)/rhodanese-related sulfurtransferase
MIIEQIYTKCLAQGAYYIESNGEAAVIDPLRETQQYIDLATANRAKIKYVFETHFHADFVSGHVDLAKNSGAQIVYGPTAETSFESIIASDNQEFKIGELTIKVLHTPGHTSESVTYLLIDGNGKPTTIFTGDTLFLGDVGRPDLAIKSNLTQNDLAGMLFDSLRNRIMPLADDIIVYPGHGAGSSCGKNMSSETVDTLGNQKKTNYALRADMTREEFIKELTTGILPPPQYFPKNALMNKNGYEALDEVMKKGTKALNLDDFKAEIENGALVLDVRDQADFILGFIPNSLFVGLNGTFAMWVGALIEDIEQKIVLITPEGQEEETVMRLSRVGYDNTLGYLKGGIASWDGELKLIHSIPAKKVEENRDDLTLIDVRKPIEFNSEHIVDATHYSLDFMNENLNFLEKDKSYHLYCGGGYRSVIAISLLMKKGYTNLTDIAGGWGALKNTSLPKTAFVCPSTL